jgi:hypothetical protein
LVFGVMNLKRRVFMERKGENATKTDIEPKNF